MSLNNLGLAAGAVAMLAAGSAYAADLPIAKAEPVAYVKICDAYGRAFYYIPGTNTCLRVRGRVRFELGWHRAQNNWVQNSAARAAFGAFVVTPGVGQVTPVIPVAPAGGTFNNGARLDTLGWRTRAYIGLDARTQTSWGTVQTVMLMQFRNRTGIFNSNPITGPGGSGTPISLQYAYIRFAGFTVGRAPWIFAAGPTGRFYWDAWGGDVSAGSLQIAYTAVFGGGFSATIAIEDKDNSGRQRAAPNTFTNVLIDPVLGIVGANLGFPGGSPGTFAPVHPNRLPNLVINMRLDQGWGNVQVSAAVGQNRAVFNNGNGIAGVNPMRTQTSTGWAVGASAQINLPQLARGNALFLFVGYSSGLNDYLASGRTVNLPGERASGGYIPAHNNWNVFACGSVAGVITTVCSQNTKALSAMVAFTHYWTPTLRSNFSVSYLKMTPGSAARSVDWFQLGGQPTSSAWQASANLIWSPVSGFDLGLEVFYAKLTNKLACNSNVAAFPGACTPWGNALLSPSTVGVSQNPSDIRVKFRAQRDF